MIPQIIPLVFFRGPCLLQLVSCDVESAKVKERKCEEVQKYEGVKANRQYYYRSIVGIYKFSSSVTCARLTMSFR